MESAIRLCYCSLPSAPQRLSFGTKGSSDAKASRFHLRFNHASLRLSHFSTTPPVARSFVHANCMLDRFSVPPKNDGGDNKILRGVTGVSLVLACVIGLFNFSSKINPAFHTAYASGPPTIMPYKQLPGGEAALESLLKTINADEEAYPNPPVIQDVPDKADVDALKLYAVGQSKSGKKREALKILEEKYNKLKNHHEDEVGYNLEMALVELLIFQENFKEARKRLDHLIDGQVGSNAKQLNYKEKIEVLLQNSQYNHSIPPILLYKAIVHTMLENKEAAKWLEAFGKTLPGNEDQS